MTHLNQQILLSPEDEYLRSKHIFYLDFRGYPTTTVEGVTTRLHQLLELNYFVVDHKDRNKLNNKRDNLREATFAENTYNRSKHKDNKSGYKGVSPFRGKWKAKLTKEGVDYYLGIFSSKEQAALMYDMAAKKHFEKFAALNFELDLG